MTNDATWGLPDHLGRYATWGLNRGEPSMPGPTQSTESAALHAVIKDDLDEARRIIATMLPGERRQLITQAHKLADLIQEHSRLLEACAGTCSWAKMCDAASNGYYIYRGSPFGVCQRHTFFAEEAGYAVHPRPTEVTL